MADIDTISKYLIQHYPEQFARFTLGRDDVEVIDILSTEQTTVQARQADSFIRVRIGDEEALLHYEFQTTDSTNPPMRAAWPGILVVPLSITDCDLFACHLPASQCGTERSWALYPGAFRLPNRDSLSRDQAD